MHVFSGAGWARLQIAAERKSATCRKRRKKNAIEPMQAGRVIEKISETHTLVWAQPS
jgi:hypothetical protein